MTPVSFPLKKTLEIELPLVRPLSCIGLAADTQARKEPSAPLQSVLGFGDPGSSCVLSGSLGDSLLILQLMSAALRSLLESRPWAQSPVTSRQGSCEPGAPWCCLSQMPLWLAEGTLRSTSLFRTPLSSAGSCARGGRVGSSKWNCRGCSVSGPPSSHLICAFFLSTKTTRLGSTGASEAGALGGSCIDSD